MFFSSIFNFCLELSLKKVTKIFSLSFNNMLHAELIMTNLPTILCDSFLNLESYIDVSSA